MAKVKINTKGLEDRIKKKWSGFTQDEDAVSKIARKLVENIKTDTRKGIGYDGKAFPALASSTIDRREKLATVNDTHEDFSPAKSNATFMGDTIRNIIATIKKKGIFSSTVIFELTSKGIHRKVKGLRVKTLSGSNSENNKALMALEDKGWNILGMSVGTKQFIKERFIKFINKRKR